MNDVIFVWCENVNANAPAPPPTLSVSAWPFLFGQDWLRWDTSSIANVPEAARTARIAFCNLFHTADSINIQQIRQVNPDCYIVAMPDPSIDLVLAHPDWMNMHRQMALADAIGGRTHADADVYGTLLNKKTFWIPSPVGPSEYFAAFRDLPKKDYILTLDHAFAPPNTYCNVAAVAAAQRATGRPVIYAAARDWTLEYAKLAGLEAKFVGRIPFADFIKLTAEAAICIDAYAAHSYGRQQVLCGMVGTICIGSELCADAPGMKIDPFNPKSTGKWAKYLKLDRTIPANTEQTFGFAASIQRMETILSEIGVTV